MALKPTPGLRSFVTDWRRAPPFHETIKSGLSTEAGIGAEHAAIQSGNIKSPRNKEAGLDVSHHALVSREGRGENFFLTSSFSQDECN